jgi:DEAD/DEAH box helicase domain-containing protein
LKAVRAYRGGYLASERREIERQLFEGELLGVISTSALELGIDVGGLDACLMVGYPGSIASLWQRAGRAGRSASSGASLVVLIASESPIDQYLMHHPDYLLARSPEHAVVDADNAYILAKHLRCAAAELPYSLAEARTTAEYAPALLQLLEEEKQLRRAGDAWYWAKPGSPSRDVSLRDIGENSYSIMDSERGHVIGTVDETMAFQVVHSEAIYLHEAETYFVDRLDLTQRIAYARRAEVDYFTQAMSEAKIQIDDTEEEKPWRDSKVAFGGVTVTFTVPMFKKVKFGSLDSLGYGTLDLPPQTLETVALWLVPPPDALRRLREFGRVPHEGMLGIANAVIGVMPLRVMCDSSDLGAVVDSAQLGAPTLFLFDKYPGGLGFAQRGYDLIEPIVIAALEGIAECPCEDGCPSCVGSAQKNYTYYDVDGEARERIPDKEAALVILHEMLGLQPYIPRRTPAGSTPVNQPIEQLPPAVEDKVRRQLQRLKK